MKTVLITGATSGIGLAGAEALAKAGWRVLVHARTEARGQGALDQLRKAVPQGSFAVVTGDLSSLAEVEALADQVAALAPTLDALWNNAGGLLSARKPTADGLEWQMGVNHLAAFALTARLLPQLKAAPAARVVATSSLAHLLGTPSVDHWFADRPGRYRPMGVYGQTKLANILFTQELQRRLEGTSVTTHCFHPGWVRTGFGTGSEPRRGDLISWAAKRFALAPSQGADTGVFLVDSPEPPRTPGLYWVKRRPVKPAKSTTPEAARRLWDQSERVLSDRGRSV